MIQRIITLLLLLSLWSTRAVIGQDLQQSFLFDFGLSSNETASPDANGKTWNNITATSAGSSVTLVDITGVTTSATLEITKTFGANNAGGFSSPDASLLGDIALSSATSDYFYKSGSTNGTFKLTNLNAGSGYKLKLFASRVTTNERSTKYTITGKETYSGLLQTSGTGIGNAGGNGNDDTFYEPSFYVTADDNGEILIDVISEVSQYSYIGAMILEEYTNIPKVDVTSFSFEVEDMLAPQAPQNITMNIEPAHATVRTAVWSSSDESIAIVDNNGIVYPVSNGEVTITGTSNDPSGDFTQSTTITISNQINELYIDGMDLGMDQDRQFFYQDHINGYLSNIFYAYLELTAGQEFDIYTFNSAQEKVNYGLDATSGKLAINGDPITATEAGVYMVKADFNKAELNLVKISDWKLVGTQTPGSWGSGDGPELEHQGGAIWSSVVTFERDANETYNAMLFRQNGGQGHLLFGTLSNNLSTLSYKNEETSFGTVKSFALSDGEYKVTLNLEDYSYKFEATSFNENGIAFCGSSVAQGWGSVDGHSGYAWMYSNLLNERFNAGKGKEWGYKNISIGGDNTIKVDNRYDLYVLSAGQKYVVFGLSLANEGIMSGGQPIFDQFKTNLQALITRARNDGYVPVVMNNYANGSYTLEHYEYIKEMNLLIHQWDVPSMNLLGALDDGAGQFINGENGLEDYESDPAHPNDLGHKEFFHSMVPSMFDALDMGKSLPIRVSGEGFVASDYSALKKFTFTPDGEVHSFTNVFYVKTDATGKLLSFNVNDEEANLSINAEGQIVYSTSSNTLIEGPTVVNDNQWHTITLTHYHAREKTLLYTGKVLQGEVSEKIIPTEFKLHNIENASNLKVKDWFFYRAGMNALEIDAIVDGLMLKSGLELYVPFTNNVEEESFKQNLALSTVEVSSEIIIADQTINFAPLETKKYGDDAFNLEASTNSNLTIEYTSSNPEVASIDGNTVTIHKVGETQITASQSGNLNYSTAENVIQTLVISPAELTASVSSSSMVYGSTVPSFEVSYSGFVNDEDISVLSSEVSASSDVTSSSLVGSYAITLSGGASSNYSFVYENGTVEVTKAELTASVSSSSMVYGSSVPSFEVSYSGFVNDEDVSVLTSEVSASSDVTSSSSVGSYAITLSGGESSNYSFVYDNGTVEVTKAELTASVSSSSMVYGSSVPSFEVSYSGFVNDEDASDLTSEVSASSDVTSSSSVGSYTITLSGGESSNYSFVYDNGTVEITKAELTASVSSSSMVYGSSVPSFEVSYSGFVNDEDVSVLTSEVSASSEVSSSSSVGSYAITLSGGESSNYSLVYDNGTVEVTKAELTASVSSSSMVYGSTVPSFEVSYSGFVNDEDASVLISEVSASSDVTSSSSVGSYTITLSGGESSNYSLVYDNGTVEVTKAELTASVSSSSMVYGSSVPSFEVSYSGFVNDEDASVLTSEVSASSDITSSSSVGSYAITLSGGENSNYSFVYDNGTLEVTKAELTASVSSSSMVYGSSVPSFEVSYSGFVNDEDASVLISEVSASSDVTSSSSVGSYAITLSGGESSNYSFVYENSTVEVTKAELTASVSSSSMVYGSTVPSFEVSYSGFVNDEDASVLTSEVSASSDVTSSSSVGSYTITLSGGASSNYSFVYDNGTVEITKAELTASVSSSSMVYGSSVPSFEVSYSGFVNDEDASVLISEVSTSSDVTSSSSVGSYTITLSGGESSNYSFIYENGILEVIKAELTASVSSSSMVYGSSVPSFEVSYSGFVNDEDASVLSSEVSVSSDVTSSSSVGSYAITLSGGASSNYSLVYENGTVEVTKAELTASVSSSSMVYGSTVPSFEVSYSGFVNDEDASVLSSEVSASSEVSSSSSVGSYVITLSGGESSNYSLVYENGTIEITQATLQAIADSYSETYGDDLPEFTYSITGFVNDESIANLMTLPTVQVETHENYEVGDYIISIQGGEDKNYKFEYSNGILQINKADQELSSFVIADTLFVGDEIELSILSSSGLEVKYEISDEEVAVIEGNNLKILKEGQIKITAIQEGSNNYNPALSIDKTIVVINESVNEPVTSVDLQEILEVSVYPNPASTTFSLDKKADKIQIFNTSGIIVKDFIGSQDSYDVSSLNTGLYMLLIEYQGKSYKKKLLVN